MKRVKFVPKLMVLDKKEIEKKAKSIFFAKFLVLGPDLDGKLTNFDILFNF